MNFSIKSIIAMISLSLCMSVFAADDTKSANDTSATATSSDSSASNEKETKNSKQWICTTNASSASTDADKAADKNMENAKAGKNAFDYALKHCRDCTKITCKSE